MRYNGVLIEKKDEKTSRYDLDPMISENNLVIR